MYTFLLNTKKMKLLLKKSNTSTLFFSKPSREKLSNFNTDQETSDLIPPLPCSKNNHRSSYFRAKTEGSRKRAARKATQSTQQQSPVSGLLKQTTLQ